MSSRMRWRQVCAHSARRIVPKRHCAEAKAGEAAAVLKPEMTCRIVVRGDIVRTKGAQERCTHPVSVVQSVSLPGPLCAVVQTAVDGIGVTVIQGGYKSLGPEVSGTGPGTREWRCLSLH